MNGKLTIAVIFGGQSPEHDVSRMSACSVIKNIDKEKYNVVTIGINKQGKWLNYNGPAQLIENGEWETEAKKHAKTSDNINMFKYVSGKIFQPNKEHKAIEPRRFLEFIGAENNDIKIDVVFPVLHGCNGEDGTVQGFFELMDIPYVGAEVLSSAVGMDKYYSKVVFEKANIPQADYLLITRKDIETNEDDIIKQIEDKFDYPCFVKPCNAGSSIGITKAHDRKELICGLKTAVKYDRKILAEEYIDGREIECSVLGNDKPQASTVGEIIPANEFYDYDAKYNDTGSKLIIPAELPLNVIQDIRDYATKAFKAIDCSGFARVDFFVDKGSNKIYINEINTIPGFTNISMYPKLWEASGVSYTELIDKLIKLAIERHKENKREYNR